jgi:hypothetical protein
MTNACISRLFLSYRSGLHLVALNDYSAGSLVARFPATMPSADFSHVIGIDCPFPSQFASHATLQGFHERSPGVRHRTLSRVNAGFIKHTPVVGGRLHGHVPTGPECTIPHIRFLFVAPRFWIALPPDPASRLRPCPSPNLRPYEHLVWGPAPHYLCAMPGTRVNSLDFTERNGVKIQCSDLLAIFCYSRQCSGLSNIFAH